MTPKPTAASLLAEMKPATGGMKCDLCSDEFKKDWSEVMDAALAEQRRISVSMLHRTLQALRKARGRSPYPYQKSAMENHLRNHDQKRYFKLNLVKRGRANGHPS